MAIDEQDVPAEVKEQTDLEKNIPIEKLRVRYVTEPEGYARLENPRRTKRLIDKFDPMALGVLYLSLQDDGTYNVIDGQHRFKAALAAGLQTVDALVFIDLTNEEEAGLYRKFGDYLRQTARDRFLAALVEGQPESLVIDRLLGEVGLHVSTTGGPERGGVNGVQALEFVARDAGPQVLRDTLKLLHDVFGEEMRGFSAVAIAGTAQFIERYQHDPMYQRAKLVGDMRREGLLGISIKMNAIRALETGRTALAASTTWGRAMLLLHNSGLRTRKLGDWPSRIMRPADRARRVENMRQYAAPAGIAARRLKAAESAMAHARCPSCRSEPGAACLKLVHGRSVPMNGQVHRERYAAYRDLSRRKIRNGSS